jgi:hypothetical protein
MINHLNFGGMVLHREYKMNRIVITNFEISSVAVTADEVKAIEVDIVV